VAVLIGAVAIGGAIGLGALALVLTTRSEDAARTSYVEALTTARGAPNVDYTLDLNTGVRSPLPDALIVSAASFGSNPETKYAVSSDGSRLAYVGLGDDDNAQIFVADMDGTGIRQVTRDSREAMSPAWSPDGRAIAYAGYGGGDVRNLFILDVATGETRQVTDGTHDVWDSQFTPDGLSLLYTGGTNQVPLLMTVPVAGGKSTLFLGPSEGLTDAGNGSLSPDGSLVTFLGGGSPKEGQRHCGPCRFVAKADGTDRRVIPGWYVNPAGAWSPDGSRIVESRDDRSIVVVDIATGDESRVARGRAAIWLDRQTLLIDVA
jgi:Tol biopolymer transport system component